MPRVGVMRKIVAALGIADPMEVDEFRALFADDGVPEIEHGQALSEATDPVLADLWDNDEDAVYDEASEVRALGARVRYEDASGGGPDTSAGLEDVIRRAKSAGLPDEEARSAAALAARYAYGGELDKAAESGQHGIGHHPFAEGAAVGTAALHRAGHHLRLRVGRHAPAEAYPGQEVRVCLVR